MGEIVFKNIIMSGFFLVSVIKTAEATIEGLQKEIKNNQKAISNTYAQEIQDSNSFAHEEIANLRMLEVEPDELLTAENLALQKEQEEKREALYNSNQKLRQSLKGQEREQQEKQVLIEQIMKKIFDRKQRQLKQQQQALLEYLMFTKYPPQS